MSKSGSEVQAKHLKKWKKHAKFGHEKQIFSQNQCTSTFFAQVWDII